MSRAQTPALSLLVLSAVSLLGFPGTGVGQATGTVAYYRNTYGGGDYALAEGDWQAEATARYHFAGPFGLGAGVTVGKFDDPASDPSFTSVAVYLEPSVDAALSSEFGVWAGGRYGWAHERVGSRERGLWGWGWEAGGAAGVDYALRAGLGIGLQVEAMRLDLARDEDLFPASASRDREGWRLAAGIGVRLGGR